MKRCPACQRLFPDDVAVCDVDGQALGSLPVDRAVRVVVALCEAVEALRDQGRPVPVLRPRDVERADGTPADAVRRGLPAGAAEDLETRAAYAPPEVFRDHVLTAAGSVYNLAAVLYELLTGTAPFRGASAAAVAVRQMLERPRSPRELRPEISPALAEVVLRALDKQPDARPASPAALAVALRAALAPVPGVHPEVHPGVHPAAPAAPFAIAPQAALRDGPPEAPARPRGRGIALASGAAVVLLVALGTSALVTLRGGSPPTSRLPAETPPTTVGQSAPDRAPVSAPVAPVSAPTVAPVPAPMPAPVAPTGPVHVAGHAVRVHVASPNAGPSAHHGSDHGTGRPANPIPVPGSAPTVATPTAVPRSPPTPEAASVPTPPHDAAPSPRAPQPQASEDLSLTPLGWALVGLGLVALLGGVAAVWRAVRARRRPAAVAQPAPTPPPRVVAPVAIPPTLVTPAPVVTDVGSRAAPRPEEWTPRDEQAPTTEVPRAEVAVRCPRCGLDVPADGRFCPHDGTSLPAVAGAQGLLPDALPRSMPRATPLPRAGGERDGDGMDAFVVGQYRCFARLGEGGMGVVYKARHVHLDRLSAVKVLLPQTAMHDRAVDLFRREARLASSLSHPNVVTIYDYGEVDASLFYLAMEFIPGRTLADVIRERPLPLAHALALTRQVCDGLDVAHQEGIVHRDLKPLNIMVCHRAARADLVKIVDFGIARALSRTDGGQTLAGLVVGTPAYMAPEQARGEADVDPRADVFSLAVVVYEMLSGRLPFGDGPRPALQQVVERATLAGPPAPLALARPGLAVPPGVDAALARALAPDRAGRTPTAPAFLADLERGAA